MKENFEIIYGTFPVLITAPHAFGARRKNLTGVVRPAEMYTDEIAREIANGYGASALIPKTSMEYDPNYEPYSPKKNINEFKASVADIVKKDNVKFVIDLHGLSDQMQYDFAIYFPSRFHKSRKLAFNIASAITRGQLRDSIVQILNFPEDERESIGQFAVNTLEIAAVQVEVARYIREDELLKAEFISNIGKFISEL